MYRKLICHILTELYQKVQLDLLKRMDVIGGMLADNTEVINNCIKGKEIISCIDNYNNISFEILNSLL